MGLGVLQGVVKGLLADEQDGLLLWFAEKWVGWGGADEVEANVGMVYLGFVKEAVYKLQAGLVGDIEGGKVVDDVAQLLGCLAPLCFGLLEEKLLGGGRLGKGLAQVVKCPHEGMEVGESGVVQFVAEFCPLGEADVLFIEPCSADLGGRFQGQRGEVGDILQAFAVGGVEGFAGRAGAEGDKTCLFFGVV